MEPPEEHFIRVDFLEREAEIIVNGMIISLMPVKKPPV